MKQSRVFTSVAILTVTLAGATQTSLAQAPTVDRYADSVRAAIETAVNAGDARRIDEAIALTDRALSAFPQSPLLLHYRAYALYRAGSLKVGLDKGSEARQYLVRARAILEQLTKGETLPESYAVLSAVYGLQIAVSRVPAIAGMQLGSKSKSWMDRAVRAAPENPRVLLLQGIGDFHTPASFGGGIEKAEQHLQRAIALFPGDHPAPQLPSWGLADAHLWLGRVYMKQNRRDAARAEFQKALALQPENAWIRMVLLPALDQIK